MLKLVCLPVFTKEKHALFHCIHFHSRGIRLITAEMRECGTQADASHWTNPVFRGGLKSRIFHLWGGNCKTHLSIRKTPHQENQVFTSLTFLLRCRDQFRRQGITRNKTYVYNSSYLFSACYMSRTSHCLKF
jgi:hypothetical protein